MKIKQLLLAFLFLCLKNTIAQPVIQWQKSFGGTNYDQFSAIHQTTDGGYIVAGGSNSIDGDVTGNHGSYDYWIVKLNNAGSIQWQKSIGGTGNEGAIAIQQTTDGGFITLGTPDSWDGDITGGYHGGGDYGIVKLNSSGSIQWQKCLGGTGVEEAHDVHQTSDGGYIAAGGSMSNDGDVTGNHGDFDYWIVKLDSSGTLQWQKCLGGAGDDRAKAIQQTTDGGYIVTGYSESTGGDVTGNHGRYDYWLVKLNSAGSIQWQKSLGGTQWDDAWAIQQTPDGGYIVAGETYSTDGDVTGNHLAGSSDYWIVKLDTVGTIQWKKCLGGTGGEDRPSVQQTNDGGYIIAGYSSSNDGDVTGHHGSYMYGDYWIVKLDNAGSIEWQKSLGGTDTDYGRAVQQTTDGGYIVAGSSYSNDGDVSGNHGTGTYDYWIAKLDPYVGIDKSYTDKNSFSIFPNPSKGNFILLCNMSIQNASVTILNTLGEKIYSEPIGSDIRKEINLSVLSGIYFVKVYDGGSEHVQKLIVE